MSIWLPSLASVVAVSLVSLVGLATLAFGVARVRRMTTMLVSFAVGALLGDAFIHLLPEALSHGGPSLRPSLLVLAGMLVFFVVEKLLKHSRAAGAPQTDVQGRASLAAINIIGDAVHNFIDGALIGASYLVSPVLGVSTTVAVVLHEIPQELGDFGVLLHSGLSVKNATLLNLASASIAVVGTVATLLVGTTASAALTTLLVPLAAGGFVYIAAADLIPELQRERTWLDLAVQTSLIALGVGVMAALTLLE